MKYLIAPIVGIIATFTVACAQVPSFYKPPLKLDDGWQVSHWKDYQMDTTRIIKLLEQLQKNTHQIHSFLLIKDNQLILEAYYDKYTVNHLHDLRSVTKSITTLLMGIAIDKGFIESIDAPIFQYLSTLHPQKNLLQKKKITIRHLLTMSTGLDCNDWDKRSKGQEDKAYIKKDLLQYFIDLPVVHPPGTVAQYCTLGQILANEIISQAANMPIDAFAQQYLFTPLGITDVEWHHTTKRSSIPLAAKRLYLAPRALAKIGQLMLDKGKWKNQAIVSAQWLNLATTPQVKITGIDYGFYWWQIPFQVNHKEVVSVVATGNGGQYIFTFPSLRLVVVFTGGAYNQPEDKIPFSIIKEVCLPAFMNRE
ncbi:MAG: serine hydrolase [Bacteroidota bacterium]